MNDYIFDYNNDYYKPFFESISRYYYFNIMHDCLLRLQMLYKDSDEIDIFGRVYYIYLLTDNEGKRYKLESDGNEIGRFDNIESILTILINVYLMEARKQNKT